MSPIERKPRKADDFCFLTDHQLFLEENYVSKFITHVVTGICIKWHI